MSDIVFVNSTDVLSLSYETNGTMLLATKLLDAGFDTKIIRFCQIESYKKDYPFFIREITDKILQMEPRCVSFYTLWPYYHIMLRIACELKKYRPDIITILGGPQASATATATMTAADYVDYICTGEGENTVVPFFQAVFENNKEKLACIPGLYSRVGDAVVASHNIDFPLCDLNTLPHWDERLYVNDVELNSPRYTANTYFMPIDVGRGCPFSCTFCCSSRFWRRAYRLKSPERIVEDILYFNQKFGIKSFLFSHDAFTTNNQLVSKVCDHILDSGLDIKWKCTSRIDCLTEDLVLKMKKAGMTRIELGIETGSLRMQKLINKKLNLGNAKSMVAFLLKNKIHVSLFFMYGFPDETEQDLNETLEFFFTMIEMGVQYASMSFCKFNPSTQITNECFDQLVFDPSIKILSRGVFGYKEELLMIQENKAIFPFFYHLRTPVRDKYQYLYFLSHLYQKFPNSIHHLRKLYNGDNLKFYKDFYNNNLSFFEEDMAHAVNSFDAYSLEILYNTIKDFNPPYIRQLKALLRYDYNVQRISKSKNNISVQEIYDFSYTDFKLKLPIEEYSDGKTEILLQKVDGVKSMKILKYL